MKTLFAIKPKLFDCLFKAAVFSFCLFEGAQAKSFFLETATGFSLSQLETTEDYAYFNRHLGTLLEQDQNSKSETRKGCTFRFGFGYDVTNHFAFLIGLSHEEKGNRSQYTDPTPDTLNFFITDWRNQWNLQYLTIPLLCQISFRVLGGTPFCRFGLGFSRLVASDTKATLNGVTYAQYFDSIELNDLDPYNIISYAYWEEPFYESLEFKKYDMSIIGSVGYAYEFNGFLLFLESSIATGVIEVQGTNDRPMSVSRYTPSGTVKNAYLGAILIGCKVYVH